MPLAAGDSLSRGYYRFNHTPQILSRMSRRTLTSEQHQAIVTRDVSVALSAGAGCGKTAAAVPVDEVAVELATRKSQMAHDHLEHAVARAVYQERSAETGDPTTALSALR